MLEINKRAIRTLSILGPSGAFGSAMEALLDEERDVDVLTADLRMYSGLDRISRRFPDRLYDIGIAEQNMLGIAAGMAKEGATVFASTYAAFGTTRSLDQVRVNMGYSRLPVKLVGLSCGLNSSLSGSTHTSCGDLAIMRSIPNVTILSPCDCLEVVKACVAAADIDGPVYLRLRGGSNVPMIYKEDYDFQVGKAVRLREGSKVAFVATGAMVAVALEASELIEKSSGVSPVVLNMHTIKPYDNEAIRNVVEDGVELIVTIEEHRLIGGLGDATLDCLNELEGRPVKLMKIGVPDQYLEAASFSTLAKQIGLTPDAVAEKVLSFLGKGE